MNSEVLVAEFQKRKKHAEDMAEFWEGFDRMHQIWLAVSHTYDEVIKLLGSD